ncbi:hypothetical protein DPMN_178627 [Dreissena polymorpha]|uniref:Uncharacterized protein n=1 Tax=Dreissena polymorpha TaxID=45954 RepID=A0A9D4EEL9_DREPO|nr:hypothetical protein DPMN_178627 [Dreissena polymorpha]
MGVQIPKEISDARKPLYDVMRRAKESGKNVKFNGPTLCINGSQYKATMGQQ